jgi:hypothetical protein
MKYWRVLKVYFCVLAGENCGDKTCDYSRSVAPECGDCDTYLEWKKSGLSIEEFARISNE